MLVIVVVFVQHILFSFLRQFLLLVIQLQEDLHEKQKQELEMKEDLEGLKGRLRSEKKYLEEIICERDKLRNLCDEKDSAIQVSSLVFAKNELNLQWCLHLLMIDCL